MAPVTVTAKDALVVAVTAPGSGGRTKTWPCPPDLRYTITAPGGFDTLSATLTVPDPSTPPLDVIQAGAPIEVVDGRTGDTLWYGTLDDPGSAVTYGRSSFKVTATGRRKILETVSHAYALCDRDLGNWTPDNDWPQSSPTRGPGTGFVAHPGDWPTDDPDGYWEFPQPDDSKMRTNDAMQLRYRPLARSADRADLDTRLVWMFASSDCSTAGTADDLVQVYVQTADGLTTNKVAENQWSTTILNDTFSAGVGAWVIDAYQAIVGWRYTGAAVTRAADRWLRFANLALYFQVLDKDGNRLTPGQTVTSLHAGGILNDMVGRFLKGRVEAGATVFNPNTPAVDQAAWWGGATAREIADFVQDVQPDYWWAVWEPGPSGLPRFEYRPWRITGATGVGINEFRYLFTPRDTDLRLAGGIDDLYNRALVIYERADGVPASLYVSGTVAELTYLKETRTAVVDLTGRGPVGATTASNLGLAELSRLNQ